MCFVQFPKASRFVSDNGTCDENGKDPLTQHQLLHLSFLVTNRIGIYLNCNELDTTPTRQLVKPGAVDKLSYLLFRMIKIYKKRIWVVQFLIFTC